LAEGGSAHPRGLRADESSEEGYETSDPRAHYAELDALRGVAIFGVVVTHLATFWLWGSRETMNLPLLDVSLLDLLLMGYLGVPLFFLLSGYLLTWTEEKRARQGSYSTLSYVKRRALRLVPAYYAAIVLVVLVWPTNPPLGDVALLFTFLHGFKPAFPVGLDPALWSLTPEIVFYAILPLLILKFRSLWQRVAIFAALFALSVATRLLMGNGFFDVLPVVGEAMKGNRMYFYPTTLLYLFLVGVLLRMMVERLGDSRWITGWRPYASSVAAVAAVATVALLPYPFLPQGLPRSPLAVVAELMVVVFFAAALLGAPLLRPILTWRPLMFVGKISYSLFLLHMTVIFLSARYLLFELRPWFPEQSDAVIWASFAAATPSPYWR
jgi:peptidoglycan/LPS O-acetylase OafA/YrhL